MWNDCIEGLLKDSTVLLATHQLTYLSKADYIYNLKKGEIIEEGKPDELLAQENEISVEYENFISGTK